MITDLQAEVAKLSYENKCLQKENTGLSTKMMALEEEHRAFTKVSKLISLENENAKLRAELQSTQQRLAGKAPVKAPPPTPESVSDHENSDAIDAANMKEKVIGDKTYFVDDDKCVYERVDENTVGSHVGTLVRQNGRTKMVWL